jgi:MmyB-like transcription regulator ligand binding domain
MYDRRRGVRRGTRGSQYANWHFHHPVVGDLTLAYEALELPADPGLTIFAYTAEPNSPSHDALNLFASWTATPNQVAAVQADEEG